MTVLQLPDAAVTSGSSARTGCVCGQSLWEVRVPYREMWWTESLKGLYEVVAV